MNKFCKKESSRGNREDLEKFLLIAWGFWYKRNQRVCENKSLKPEQVVDHDLSLLKDHKDFKDRSKKTSQVKCCWIRPPPHGILKLDVDEAVFHDQHKARVDILLRDDKGEVVMAASKKECKVNDPIEIELLAMFRELQLCIQWDIPDIILESDSLLMVQALQAEGESLFVLGNLIKETRELRSLVIKNKKIKGVNIPKNIDEMVSSLSCIFVYSIYRVLYIVRM